MIFHDYGEDWLGWIIFVFNIAAIITSIIKVLIEYPGLTGLKCVYNGELEDCKSKETIQGEH